MGITKICLILTALLLSTGMKTALAQEKSILIAGRTVDRKGTPISKAIVTLFYPPCRNCIDHILPVSFSLQDGVFFLEATNISPRGLKLFIGEPVPTGFWSPFGSPPFDNLSHLPQFRGIPIRTNKIMGRDKIHIDVGDVQVRIRWGKVIVKLSELFGKQHQPDRGDLGFLNLTLRDRKGKVIYDNRVPEAAFDSMFSDLKLALPEGKWLLELTNNRLEPKQRSPRLSINVNSLSCVTVTLIQGKQHQATCN